AGVDEQERHIPAGSTILLRPRDFSHRRTIGGVPSRQSWIAVVPDALTSEQLTALDAAPVVQPLSAALCGVQASIIHAAADLDAAHSPAEESLLALIVGALLLYVEEARRAGSLASASPRHPAVGAAREAVRRQLNERIGLRELATAAHVSPEHLVRLFRQELGTTPARYLWAERVQAGVHLLEHTALPIAEVAHRAGFQTASHFTRTVRRSVGMLPGELRRRSASPAAAAGDVAL
ncbi:MAG: AraC family transcriptional regulator, partial [Chloroflexota bacterium]|nr:AraC family transcriptional regulator [Chloroflexota bacterium]